MNRLRSLIALLSLLPALAHGQIALRGAASGFNDGMAIQQNAVGALAEGTGATVNVTAPARTVGDLLLLVVEVRDTNALTIPNWTLLVQGTTGTGQRGAVYWRIATNTATDNAAISHAATPSARDLLMAHIVGFSNVDTANPFDGTPSIGASATNTVATGGVTTTNSCSLRVATVHIADNNTISSAPAGFFQSFYTTSNTGADGGVGLWMAPTGGAGAQPSLSFTHSAADPAHASQFALRPAGITIAVPAGTAAGDVMVASIVTRPANTNAANAAAGNICAPAGWALVRDTINNNGGGTGGGGSRLQTYVRVATGAEPADYTWYAELNNPTTAPATIFVSGAGGIVSYSGVDNTTPVDVENGNVTASSLSHTASAVVTTVTNTMLVATHSYLSADTWVNNVPASMTERVDRPAPAAPPGNDVGVALRMADEPRATVGASGTRMATASGLAAADQGIAHMLALRPAPPSTPGRFNAFDTGTAAGAIAGFIRTRVAGAAISFDVVAINPAFTGVLTTFTGAVLIELVDASDNTGALNATTNCRASWTSVVATVTPNPTFVLGDNGRKTVSITVPNVYRDVRVRVTYPATGTPTAIGCSTDNFAIRPSGFSIAVSDSTWDTAGTARALDNTGGSGGRVHKAGRPMTIRVTPAPASATNYNGDATVSTLACTLPAGCANGLLTVGAYSNPVAGSGVRETTTASYNEAGAFNLTMVDATFANVDAADGTPADCTASGRYVCQSPAPVAVGRFVPDHFAFTSPNSPEFRTFDTAACAGRSFTYVGQPFGYVTRPSATVEARSAGGTITTNYRGALFKLLAASLAQTHSMAGKTINPSLQTALLSAIGNGTATYTAHANDKIAFNRDPSNADAPFNAAIALTWVAEDSSENAANQGIITTSPSHVFNAIGFDFGNEFRYGRLRLANANGSQLASLPVLMELQYRNSVGAFITNAADSCTSIASEAVSMTFTPNLVPSPSCKTLLSGGGQFSSGRRTLVLSAPGNGNQGAATLTVNLNGAGATTTCTVAGAPAAAQDAARPWLHGNWTTTTFTQDANGRATFGAFAGAGEVIFVRENF